MRTGTLQNRRRFVRISVQDQVECVLVSKKLKAHVVNISQGGLLIKSEHPLEHRLFTKIRLDFIENASIHCNARVVHSGGGKKEDRFFFSGICFRDLNEDDKRKIESYISKHLND